MVNVAIMLGDGGDDAVEDDEDNDVDANDYRDS